MKYIWELTDLRTGRILCKNKTDAFKTDYYLIGYDPAIYETKIKNLCLISMWDGMIMPFENGDKLMVFLNQEEYRFASHEDISLFMKENYLINKNK